ncbi:putative glycosyltransferase EpsH [Pedobacter glucosidilyticus]|nr:glycosyltransferase family 2 protein [Pedobacter glucosidilyticus]KHJ38161.1 putative glycosyltransferase EpsH [Pedobacter glucosidilyticus]
MFSVVIPLFNKSQTILTTLSTVLNQTFKDFEIVIVNDGSTDNSIQIIREFTSDSRIKIVEHENQGVSVARNTGVNHANFNFIAFLDGDDEWLPQYLSKMKEAIELFPAAEMFCSAGLGRNEKGYSKNRQIDKYDNKVVEFNFFENPHVFLHISATVVTKQLFFKVDGFTAGMKRNEDFAFLYSAALLTQPIYSGFPLSIYVGGVDGQATRSSIYQDIDLLRDIANRYNIVYKNWLKTPDKNTLFIVFTKYELRHFLMINVINKQFTANHQFIKFLNPQIFNLFNVLEVFLLRSSKLAQVYILYVKLSKLRWMMRGFQRVK